MRFGRPALVGATAAAAIAAAVLAVLLIDGGGESSTRGGGPLAWVRAPKIYRHETLPRDRILRGQVRNDSLRPVEIAARQLELRDASGRRVDATAAFLRAFLHGLLPPSGGRERLPKGELARIGRLALLEPGDSAPLTMAWRERPGGPGRPARVDYGLGSLPVPRRVER